MARKILIAEDNTELSDIMRNYLIKNGHIAFQAFDGEQAEEVAKAMNVDLVLLDIMMPKKDGYEVCRNLRKTMDIPIIVVSAKATEDDKMKMFELGADDYLTKPFSYKEAVMRVNAQLRRYYEYGKKADLSKTRYLGELNINSERFEAKVGENILPLTANEFRLLDVLTSDADRIFSRQQLIDKVWGTEEYIDENTVAVTVARLREKLQAHGINNVVTVWGFGYKWQS